MFTISEVRIHAPEGDCNPRLGAFASITLDNAFVVRDLRVILGDKETFVAMPCRKNTVRCPHPNCGCKNHLRANYCNQCGNPLNSHQADVPYPCPECRGEKLLPPCEVCRGEGVLLARLHMDIAHPIDPYTRSMIQSAVLKEYHTQKEKYDQQKAERTQQRNDQ